MFLWLFYEIEKSQLPYLQFFRAPPILLVEFPVQWIIKNVYKTEMHAKPVQGNIVANKTNIILLLPSAWIRTCQCFSVCRRLSWKFILLMSLKQTGSGNHDTSNPNALKFLTNFIWKLILMWNISEHCWFIYPRDFSWIKMFFLTHLIYRRHWYFVHYLNVQNLYY